AVIHAALERSVHTAQQVFQAVSQNYSVGSCFRELAIVLSLSLSVGDC
ncbi:hypothetical protein TSAR_000640, partial [Trichomalopsis sarcophagae]